MYSIIVISIYKLDDIGISSNLIGLLSLNSGHCPPAGRWILKRWLAGVNSCFAKVNENDILWMQDIRIPNDTKKATKLGMIVFRDKQCFNTQFAHISSVFCPDRQASLMPLSLNNNCLSTLHFKVLSQLYFHWAKHLHSRKFECRYLSKMIVISNTPTASTWHDFRRKLLKLFFQFLFQVNCNCLHGTTSRY